jgi:hypothetical protein
MEWLVQLVALEACLTLKLLATWTLFLSQALMVLEQN